MKKLLLFLITFLIISNSKLLSQSYGERMQIEVPQNQVYWIATDDKKIIIYFDIIRCSSKDYFVSEFEFDGWSGRTIYPEDYYVSGDTGLNAFTCGTNRKIVWDVGQQVGGSLEMGTIELSVYYVPRSDSEYRYHKRRHRLSSRQEKRELKGKSTRRIRKRIERLDRRRQR